MKNLILIILILGGFGINAFSQTLPANITNYLNGNFPNWKPMKNGCEQKKWILTGDFNDDRKKDLVISFGEMKGEKYKSHFVMAFINQGETYQPIIVRELYSPINRISYGFGVYPSRPNSTKDSVLISQCKTRLSDAYEYQNNKFVVTIRT